MAAQVAGKIDERRADHDPDDGGVRMDVELCILQNNWCVQVPAQTTEGKNTGWRDLPRLPTQSEQHTLMGHIQSKRPSSRRGSAFPQSAASMRQKKEGGGSPTLPGARAAPRGSRSPGDQLFRGQFWCWSCLEGQSDLPPTPQGRSGGPTHLTLPPPLLGEQFKKNCA